MADVQNDLIIRGKVAAFGTMIAALTGSAPIVTYTPEYAEIQFTPEQQKILQDMIEKNLRAKPGAVRMNTAPIFVPPLMRVYGKYAIMLLIIAFLFGRLSK